MDILLKNVRIFQKNGIFDLGVSGDVIEFIKEKPESEAQNENTVKPRDVFDLEGRLVIPGFVDMHTHLDKTLTVDLIENKSGSLLEAINNFKTFSESVTEEQFYARGKKALEMAIIQGTTSMRSHISVNGAIGFKALEASLMLKKEYSHLIHYQIAAYPSVVNNEIDGQTLAVLEQSVKKGADLIGGCPNLYKNYKDDVEKLFNLAVKLDVDLDLHVDEHDNPTSEVLQYVAEKTIEKKYHGRVTAGHCCSLSAVSEETAAQVVRKVKEAEMNIVTLPSCNLFLIGRNDKGLIRRGVTRISEFLAAGVNISVASDNVRDPYRPFGNSDLLEEALLSAQVTRMSSRREMERIMEMCTYNPAKAIRLEKYGLAPGGEASFIVLDAKTASEAIMNQATKLYIFYKGRLTVTNKKETVKNW